MCNLKLFIKAFIYTFNKLKMICFRPDLFSLIVSKTVVSQG